MRRLVLIVSALLSLGFGAVAQEAEKYVPTPVTVSSDMVRVGNHLFYAHVVLARQTLYSIGKAYGVSSLDIIDSNPKLDLRNRPIHPGDVLLIPVRKQSPAPAAPKGTNSAPIAPRDSASAPIDSISAPIQAPDTLSAPKDTVLAQKDTLAVPADTLLVAPEDSTVVVISEEDILPARPQFVYDYVDKVHVALLLPLSADSTPNSYYLNFYFGAMLAARDLGNEGIDLDVTVLDVNSSKDFAKVGKTLEQSDVIIGPVSTKDINRTLPHLPEGKFIVSPMDPKTEAVTKEKPVILAATPATTQIEDAVSWMKSNMGPADSLIIVKEA
ncbi:MAG: LysM peptidoglycan-binding domain-containing protein, partial [Bacteroidales bacterium]|nr:LysM peptidoglycan-binding domain-containing protein [Bacteroidales bacterium]